MTVCLRASAGGHELLLEAGSVRRVAMADAVAHDIASWAGRALPVLDLSQRLGGRPLDRSEGMVIIYAADDDTGDGAVVLAVDEVKGLITLNPQALMWLPAVSERFARFFDAIAIEPIDGRHPLCLRARLDVQAIEQDDG
jgi:chemotaxis signal transduction protein